MKKDEKQRLREQVRKSLQAMGAVARADESRAIREHLQGWRPWIEAGSVCAFSPAILEPSILDPWPSGKMLALPRVAGERLEMVEVPGPSFLRRGAFGMLEPAGDLEASGNPPDLALVPGGAFGGAEADDFVSVCDAGESDQFL
jgi:5-formyltetrahydrofolate cyclo-ligase